MTDIEKWKDFLISMNIEFTTEEFEFYTEVRVKEKHIYMSYGNSLSITFLPDGSFREFSVWGE